MWQHFIYRKLVIITLYPTPRITSLYLEKVVRYKYFAQLLTTVIFCFYVFDIITNGSKLSWHLLLDYMICDTLSWYKPNLIAIVWANDWYETWTNYTLRRHNCMMICITENWFFLHWLHPSRDMNLHR